MLMPATVRFKALLLVDWFHSIRTHLYDLQASGVPLSNFAFLVHHYEQMSCCPVCNVADFHLKTKL